MFSTWYGLRSLARRTFADKAFCDKAFDIAKNPKYDGYQSGLALLVYKFFDKKCSRRGSINENIPDKELAKELYKAIIRKFRKSAITSFRQYLGCRFSRYAINKSY